MDDIYLGNPLLKKANVAQEFTQEQILEFMACKQDPVYFAKQHVKIVSLDEGLVPFKPYDFQERLIQNFHENRFNIVRCLDRLVSLQHRYLTCYITQYLMIM